MYRALIKIVVSLALALGVALAVGTTSTATAAPAHSAAVRTVAKASPCAAKQGRVNQAKRNLRKASQSLKRIERNHHARHHAAKVRAAKKHVRKAKSWLNRARRAHNVCVNNHRGSGSGGGTTSASPIQALCDAGVPQPVCDALAGLIPGGSTSLPISQLCSAAPQAQPLCDALNGGGIPSASDLQGLLTQVLNALGLGDLLGTTGLGDLTTVLNNLI
ncbi:MAG: hypothetical protein FWE71_08550 [Nocardioidaceae bacterium]|nr:hypothetical protein [Nocardioidaceae bacterium]MCL2612739.1 hypothetical protein [Nocardioidaceae bacterium]